MKTQLRAMLIAGLMLSLAFPASGAPKSSSSKSSAPKLPDVIKVPASVQMTKAQKAQAQRINDYYSARIQVLKKRLANVITPQQVKAREQVKLQMQAYGNDSKAADSTAKSAVPLTADQQAEINLTEGAIYQLELQAQHSVARILTPVQQMRYFESTAKSNGGGKSSRGGFRGR